MTTVEESPTILIVDDNPLNLKVLSATLLQNGFQIAIASDGESALELLAYHPPELILLDVMMPGLDGFETCYRLRENSAHHNIPIIFITALTDTESKVKGLSMGAVDYITKPLQYEEVLARVRIHLQIRDLMRKVLEQTIALQKLNQELRRLANTDGLTEVANRRCFNDYLNQQWHAAIENHQPISLLLCDIDYFKRYNDHYGHYAGDECLIQIAAVIRQSVTDPTALVARYGGEEFAIILPNTSLQVAIQIAQFIRQAVQSLNIPHSQSDVSLSITLSIGISCQNPDSTSQAVSLITAADKALYSVKAKGRNSYWDLSAEG